METEKVRYLAADRETGEPNRFAVEWENYKVAEEEAKIANGFKGRDAFGVLKLTYKLSSKEWVNGKP